MPSFKTKLRMNRRFLIGTTAVLVTTGVALGGVQVVPYIASHSISATSASSDTATFDVGTGAPQLFDESLAHNISLHIPQESLDEMLSDYQEDDEKTWEKATLVIDGVTIEDVGVRLKGNSTLRTLSGKQGMPGVGGPEGAGGQVPEKPVGQDNATEPGNGFPQGAEMAPGADGASHNDSAPVGGDAAGIPAMPGNGGGPANGGGPGMDTGITIDDPSTYPLLISFDKYVEGRMYQGRTELSLRPGIPSANEAVSLKLTAETGQVTQKYSFVSYAVNDSPTTTRLIIENPDEPYADELGNGVLFKADANSDFSYQGEDQTTYKDQFVQVNGEGDGDVQPIINLLKWVDSASDEEFDQELGEYIDVQSFARYLATQNLLVNQDDMAGPGKNYYLWYDYDTGLISVVSWDLNVTMSGSTDAAPTESISMGGGQGQKPTRPQPDAGVVDGGNAPDGAGGTPPMEASTNNEKGDQPHFSSGNTLKERFLASKAFSDMYLNAYWDLYDQMYGSGAADAAVDSLRTTIPLTDGFTQEERDSTVSELATWVTQRKDSLQQQRA